MGTTPICHYQTFMCYQPCLPNFQCFQSCVSWTPLLHFLLLLCQSCCSLRKVSLDGRILGLIKSAYHAWLSMMTSSEVPFLVLPRAPSTLNPPLLLLISWYSLRNKQENVWRLLRQGKEIRARQDLYHVRLWWKVKAFFLSRTRCTLCFSLPSWRF